MDFDTGVHSRTMHHGVHTRQHKLLHQVVPVGRRRLTERQSIGDGLAINSPKLLGRNL